MKNNTKLDIFLYSLSFIFIIFCIVAGIVYVKTNSRDIFLVKDPNSTDRLISDTSSVLEKGEKKGDLTYTNELPEGFIDPNDYFKEEEIILGENEQRIDETDLKVPITDPLKIYGANESIEVLEEKIIEEEKDKLDDKLLKDILDEARKKRNEGRDEIFTSSFNLLGSSGRYINMSQFIDNRGCVILPFDLSISKDRMKEYVDIYSEYSDEVTVVLLNTSYEAVETREKVYNFFLECGIQSNIDYYYNPMYDFIWGSNLNKKGYLMINNDGYIFKNSSSYDMENLKNDMVLLKENVKLSLDEIEQIKSDFYAGKYNQEIEEKE